MPQRKRVFFARLPAPHGEAEREVRCDARADPERRRLRSCERGSCCPSNAQEGDAGAGVARRERSKETATVVGQFERYDFGKADMGHRRKCEACNGSGYIVVGAGLAVLEAIYPDLPIREMVQRGWLGDVGDGEDAKRCECGFFAFWQAETHEQVREQLTSRIL